MSELIEFAKEFRHRHGRNPFIFLSGARGERAVRDLFRENGFEEAYRTNQFQGNHTDGSSDVSNTPYVHVECKWVERLNIDDAMTQAMEDAELQKQVVEQFTKYFRRI